MPRPAHQLLKTKIRVTGKIWSPGSIAGLVFYGAPTNQGQPWTIADDLPFMQTRLHPGDPAQRSGPVSTARNSTTLAPGTYRIVLIAPKPTTVVLHFSGLHGAVRANITHHEVAAFADPLADVGAPRGTATGFASVRLKAKTTILHYATLVQAARTSYSESARVCVSDPTVTDTGDPVELLALPFCPYEFKNHRDVWGFMENDDAIQCWLCDAVPVKDPAVGGWWSLEEVSSSHNITTSVRFGISGGVDGWLFCSYLVDVSDVVAP